MTTSIPYDPERSPGTWRYAGEGIKAHVTCPECRGTISMHVYSIADDGTVSPSVQCQTGGCDFFKDIKLEGWRDIYQKQEPEPEEIEIYIRSDAKEGGDGSRANPVRNEAEGRKLLAAHEIPKLILLDPPIRKKVTKKKTKKKAKKKVAKKKARP